ncbi:MAG TPA: carbohydrate binding family 9 domain-containing protein, partial [Polyangiaceae bacterium]|nr:carbohydrate binding family 9 domain-containing protein [Polyangiaceae bacterium]
MAARAARAAGPAVLTAAALLCLGRPAGAQQTFAPPPVRPTLGAARASGPLRLDGRLDEGDWARAPVSSPFLQADPAQGQPATEATEARVLFDDDYLYVGVEARDRAGEEGLRAPDLRRDFDTSNHDLVELVFDTLRDGRTATAFQVNPYGVQGDMQALDDELYEPAWDGVWRVTTTRGPAGWTAEFAIPWKTLRYAPGARSFGLQIARRVRRRNELAGWSPWPRAFSPYRLGYAGTLAGIEPPRPPLNLLVRPYAALRLGAQSGRSAELRPDGGGEVRWAPTPN